MAGVNNDSQQAGPGAASKSHHLVSAINVLKLTVDCLVVRLVDHTQGDERQAMIVDLYRR